MKKILFLSLMALTLKAEPFAWVDGNGLEWIMLPVRTTFERATDRCKEAGFSLAGVNDLLEAIDYGLTDPSKNEIFGAKAAQADWIWSNQIYSSNTLYVYVVSTEQDTNIFPSYERHWAFCARNQQK